MRQNQSQPLQSHLIIPKLDSKIEWGEIRVRLIGIKKEDVERYRKNIEFILAQDVFNIANGKAILNFDQDKNLMGIKFEIEKWKRKKT